MSIEVISRFRNQRIGDLLVASLEGLFGGSIWVGLCSRGHDVAYSGVNFGSVKFEVN